MRYILAPYRRAERELGFIKVFKPTQVGFACVDAVSNRPDMYEFRLFKQPLKSCLFKKVNQVQEISIETMKNLSLSEI
jgi:hypothetical protein